MENCNSFCARTCHRSGRRRRRQRTGGEADRIRDECREDGVEIVCALREEHLVEHQVAAVPYRKNSYHSTTVPAIEATTTLRRPETALVTFIGHIVSNACAVSTQTPT